MITIGKLFLLFSGMRATGLFLRGPWIYIRLDLNGKVGYVPRMICRVAEESSADFNRLISQSSAMINLERNDVPLEHSSTLPRSIAIKFSGEKTRRLTRKNLSKSNQEFVEENPSNFVTLDTDSSSTQDSGYGESTSFYVVQDQSTENCLLRVSFNTRTNEMTTDF